MKIWLSLLLLGICTKALAVPQKEGDALGLKDSKAQPGEEKYKKLLGLLREFTSSLKNLPKFEFDDLSDINKLESALENKDVKHVTNLLRNFILGVQELRQNAGDADAKPAANAQPAANAKPAADAKSAL